MTDNEQEDEFMKQYMKTCKEQIEKLASDPELLNQTLKPFMQMSQQLMNGGVMNNSLSNPMIPESNGMSVEKMIMQISEMINYIKENHKEIVRSNNLQDEIIQDLDEHSKRLRSLVKKLIEKFDSK